MASALTPTDYAYLIILNAAGRQLSNTEMDNLFRVRLTGPIFAKLNGGGYVDSDTKSRPYRHVLTDKGRKELGEPLAIDNDGDGERRSAGEKALWAALVAQQSEGLRAPAPSSNGVAGPAGLDDRIRAEYRRLAAGPGEYVDLTELRPLFADVSKAEFDKALVRLFDDSDVRLEPEPFGHRIGDRERRAAVHIGGEDRHKLAIGLR